MVKSSTLAVILAALIISVALTAEADGAGLVWRAVNKAGSTIGDLGDVADGCTNGQYLVRQTSNSTWICNTISAGSNALLDGSIHSDTAASTVNRGDLIYGTQNNLWGDLVIGAGGSFLYTNGTDPSWKTFQVWSQTAVAGTFITGINNSTGAISTGTAFTNITPFSTSTDATILQSNASSTAILKNLKAGTGISLTNNTNDVTITSSITQGITMVGNVADTTNSTMIMDNSTVANKVLLKTVSGIGGIQIDNGTNNLIINYTRIVSLSGNLTSSLGGTTSSDYKDVFRIPLTANSGNAIRGLLVGSTNLAGVAIQLSANVTNVNTTGECIFGTGNAQTTLGTDVIILNATAPTGSADTAETATYPTAGLQFSIPLKFDCTAITGGTPGELWILFQSETTGQTVNIKQGSFYQKTP